MFKRLDWAEKYLLNNPRPKRLPDAEKYIAWVDASYRGRSGYSACAWEIRKIGKPRTLSREVYPSAQGDSALHRGYQAGLVGAIESVGRHSEVLVICKCDYIPALVHGTWNIKTHKDITKVYRRITERDGIEVDATWKSDDTKVDEKVFKQLSAMLHATLDKAEKSGR